MAWYPQQHLEIQQRLVLAIDTMGYLPKTFKGNRWALTALCLHPFNVFAIMMKETSAEKVVKSDLSGILVHKGRSVAILSENSTAFKNKVLNEVCDQLGIKRLSCNPFHPQGNAKVENMHNLLELTLTKFFDISDLELDELPPFTCYCYNIFLAAMALNLQSSLFLDDIKQEDTYLTLTTAKVIMEPMKRKYYWRNFTNYTSIKQHI